MINKFLFTLSTTFFIGLLPFTHLSVNAEPSKKETQRAALTGNDFAQSFDQQIRVLSLMRQVKEQFEADTWKREFVEQISRSVSHPTDIKKAKEMFRQKVPRHFSILTHLRGIEILYERKKILSLTWVSITPLKVQINNSRFYERKPGAPISDMVDQILKDLGNKSSPKKNAYLWYLLSSEAWAQTGSGLSFPMKAEFPYIAPILMGTLFLTDKLTPEHQELGRKYLGSLGFSVQALEGSPSSDAPLTVCDEKNMKGEGMLQTPFFEAPFSWRRTGEGKIAFTVNGRSYVIHPTAQNDQNDKILGSTLPFFTFTFSPCGQNCDDPRAYPQFG